MTNIEQLMAANERYAAGNPQLPSKAIPVQHVAILTCMDVRIDPLSAFGLSLGEAHVLRNAGGRVTEDVVRSLAVSQQMLGTRLAIVMPHTHCGMLGLEDSAVRPQKPIAGEPVQFLGISNLETDLKSDLQVLKRSIWIPDSIIIAGFIFDVNTGRARLVEILGQDE